MKETHAANRQMAAELRARLDEQESGRLAQAAEDARGRAEDVATLKSDTAAMLSDFQAAHQVMAAEQCQRLAEDRARLTSDVAKVRDGLQAELSEARQVWSSFTTLMQQRRAGKPAAAPSPRPAVKKVVAPPPPVKEAPLPPPAVEASPEAVAPDDLTAIRGIGAGMQRHLNEGGIYTYAQLARGTPEELRRILGDVARLARVEEWIEQARKLVLA